jgi:23S rRNA pseudouridine2605 synthase
MLVRLQKLLADAGVASRRASEALILEGAVTVNGAVVRELGTKVEDHADQVAVNGQPVRVRRKLYVALHKPAGYICTRHDPEARHTVFDLLPKEWNNIYPVGRLDRASEGLIFLTNDGQFCLRLTHPRYGVRKVYLVAVEGRVELPLLEQLTKGVQDQGELLRADKARLLFANNRNSELELELTEGKNREIRRLLGAFNLVVTRLQRIRIGNIKLAELPQGKWRTLTESEISSLLEKK